MFGSGEFDPMLPGPAPPTRSEAGAVAVDWAACSRLGSGGVKRGAGVKGQTDLVCVHRPETISISNEFPIRRIKKKPVARYSPRDRQLLHRKLSQRCEAGVARCVTARLGWVIGSSRAIVERALHNPLVTSPACRCCRRPSKPAVRLPVGWAGRRRSQRASGVPFLLPGGAGGRTAEFRAGAQ